MLATGAGLAVAALYYSQPMLALLAGEFNATPAAIGLVPTLTTLGYALGIGLLAPLGDRYDRRRIILGKAAALVLALLVAAAAPSLAVLALASLAIGLSATLAQAEKTLASANTLIGPESSVNSELRRALLELSDAARALGLAADQIQAQPNSVIFGRKGSQ